MVKNLSLEKKEYEIDEVLVNKSLSLSITGDMSIEPNNDNHVPIFIKLAIPPKMLKHRKTFNSQVVDIFRSKDDVKADEVIKLIKLYTAFLFSALLFPKYQRIPFEYFHLLDGSQFCYLKFYRFDIEVAKFLRDGIMTAKNAKTRSATVSGCLHIVESLFSQESQIQSSQSLNKRERKEVELEESAMLLDAPVLSFKRPRLYIRNCSEGYSVKKEPQSENPKSDIINIEDDSSEDEEDDTAVTDDEMQFDEVVKSLRTLKRERIDKVTSSLNCMGAGQLFEGQHSCHRVAVDDRKCEDVGGFWVVKTQAKLYKQIWLKYGHIASSNVLTDSYAQRTVVSAVMTTITSMHECRFSGLTSELIDGWEENIKKAEKVEFNIGWVRKWLEDIKAGFFKKEKLDAEYIEQVDLLQAENSKLAAAKKALKEAQDNVAALQANMSPLIKEMREYAEKNSRLLSKGWLQ